MLKRVFLFLLTNLAVMLLLGLAFTVADRFGLFGDLSPSLVSLIAFSTVYGFAGSAVSLLLSKFIAKMATGAEVITRPRSEQEAWLLATVARQAQQVGIRMPEVAIYDSPELNAFATGPSKNSSLVAVSTGLLRGMRRDEVEAVLAHEVSHVANGDMVTLTLIQGVVNTFVIFIARVVGYFVDRVLLKNENGHGVGFYVTTIVAEIALGILASIIVMWFSRQREFRADAGGARLASRDKMIAALQRLKANYEPSTLPDATKAFGISGVSKSGLARLFMSHPPLDERIGVLRSGSAGSGVRVR